LAIADTGPSDADANGSGVDGGDADAIDAAASPTSRIPSPTPNHLRTSDTVTWPDPKDNLF
jgi:hypothetical protein